MRQNSVQVPGYRFSKFVGDQVITHPNLILHFKYSIAESSCAFAIFSPSMSCHFSLFSAHGGGKKLQLIYMLSWFGFQLLNSGAAITKKIGWLRFPPRDWKCDWQENSHDERHKRGEIDINSNVPNSHGSGDGESPSGSLTFARREHCYKNSLILLRTYVYRVLYMLDFR